MKVRAKPNDPVVTILDDETAGASGTYVRILSDGKTHDVDATHGRVKELLAAGELIEVQERKADATRST